MLAVVVDTSTPAVTAALVGIDVEGGRAPRVNVIAERCTVDARAHGELLAPAIAAVLTDGGVGPRDLAAFVAGLGPGPFTGLRVGLVTVATMGQALAVPTYGVCSLDGIGARTAGQCLVATDARRKEIYWAVYDGGARLHGPAVNRPGDVGPLLAGLRLAPALAAGDGARLYADALALPVLDDLRYPSPATLAEVAADRVVDKAPTEALIPLYLRRPDAVEPGTRKPVNR